MTEKRPIINKAACGRGTRFNPSEDELHHPSPIDGQSGGRTIRRIQ